MIWQPHYHFTTQILCMFQMEQKPLHHQQAPPTVKSPESGLQSAEESLTTPESETSSSSFLSPQMQHQQQHFTTSSSGPHHPLSSHSPRSSLSSVSPPVSPHVPHSEVVMPPSYDLVSKYRLLMVPKRLLFGKKNFLCKRYVLKLMDLPPFIKPTLS